MARAQRRLALASRRSGTGCGSSRRGRRRDRPARRAPTRSRRRSRCRSRAGRTTRSRAGRAAAADGRCATVGRTRCRNEVRGWRSAKRPSVPALVVDRGEHVGLGPRRRRSRRTRAPRRAGRAGSRARGRRGRPRARECTRAAIARPLTRARVAPPFPVLLVTAGAARAAAAAPAAAAERRVPQGWLGVVADGPLTARRRRRVGRHGRRGRGVRADRRVLGPAAAVRQRAPRCRRPTRRASATPAACRPTSRRSTRPSRRPPRRRLAVLPVVQATPALGGAAAGRRRARRPRDPATFAAFAGARWSPATGRAARCGPSAPTCRACPSARGRSGTSRTSPRYWSEQPFARSYVRLLRAADAALEAADPGATVVLAGLPNAAGRRCAAIYRGRRARPASTPSRCTRTRGRPARRAADRPLRTAGDAPPRRPPVADLDHRALVAGGQGPRAGSARASRSPRPAQAAGWTPPCGGSPPPVSDCGSRRVFWYTWLSDEGARARSTGRACAAMRAGRRRQRTRAGRVPAAGRAGSRAARRRRATPRAAAEPRQDRSLPARQALRQARGKGSPMRMRSRRATVACIRRDARVQAWQEA